MGLSHSPRIVTDGLVFCVDAANPRSYPGAGTVWTDLIVRHTGTLTNMDDSNFSSDNAGTLNFDGTDEYVNYNDQNEFRIVNDITVTAWVKKDTTPSAHQEIINLYRRGTSPFYTCLIFSIRGTSDPSHTDQLQFFHRNSSSQTDQLFSVDTIPNGIWTHTSVTSDTSTVRFYINGEQTATGTQSFQREIDESYTSALRIAALGPPDGSPEYLDGQISNVQMYNRALSEEEIKQNYNATKWRFQ